MHNRSDEFENFIGSKVSNNFEGVAGLISDVNKNLGFKAKGFKAKAKDLEFKANKDRY